LFREKNNRQCLFCFQTEGEQKRQFDLKHHITFRDFGLQNITGKQKILDDAIKQYLYDFILSMDDMGERSTEISVIQYYNTIDYWSGLESLLTTARQTNPPQNVMVAIENLFQHFICCM
jgi:hypothetical protein